MYVREDKSNLDPMSDLFELGAGKFVYCTR